MAFTKKNGKPAATPKKVLPKGVTKHKVKGFKDRSGGHCGGN